MLVSAKLGRRAIRWSARLVLVPALTLGGIELGLRLAGSTTTETALGRISLRVEPAWHGQVEAFIPIVDWGVRVDAFRGPVRLHIEPRSVNTKALLAAAGGHVAVLARAETDARRAARGALQRAAGWAVGGALVLGVVAALVALAGRRRVRALLGWALAPPALAAALSIGVLLWVENSFDASAFENPSFYARGAELAQLLNVADHAQAESKGYTSSIYRALAGYSTLLTAAGKLAAVRTSTEPVLQLSDLKDNKLALAAVKHLFPAHQGSLIFFVGDFGVRGTRAEARLLVPAIAALGPQVVAVSGDHDSSLFMRALAKAGVIVLTDKGRLRANGTTDGRPVQQIDGWLVAGYPAPLQWPGHDPANPHRIFSFGQLPDGKRLFRSDEARLIAWFQRLHPRPQILLDYHNGMAQDLASVIGAQPGAEPLLILTGHDHKQHVERYGKVLVVDDGTVGAGGIFGIGQGQVGLAELHLAKGQVIPRSIDLIKVQPFTGAASAERVVPASGAFCHRQRVHCHPPS